MDSNRLEGVHCVPVREQKPPLNPSAQDLRNLLYVIEHNVIPLTEQGVAQGNKVFGAAILNPDDWTLSPFCATNAETECPTFHGEVKCIVDWSKATPAAQRGPLAQRSIFLATHEPCCMCVASVLWAGFNTLYYFFPYSVTTAQGIPHDIQTMHELWGVNTYRKQNKYFSSACIMDLVEQLPDDNHDKKELQETVQRLLKKYDEMAHQYHAEKVNNKDNSLVLG